ncbi:MAG: BMP family ABC transporter substrate-binding protein [Chloroflexi bacterium]|nr:MAG: BMP family ABC transporter substrate-binding protein [Chloroflexota bacterium]
MLIFRRPCIVLLALIVILMTGCAAPVAAPATAPEAESAPADESKGSIAVLLPGPPDDNSWNEAALTALQALEAEGYTIAYSESVADADAARILRSYADQGFQLVIGHSFGYQDAVFQVASEYPDVNFAWAGGIDRTAPNVADYDQPLFEPSYLVGVIAGHVSQSGRLGALYGFDIPVCHSMGEAMLAGARTVNPDATLTVTGVGDWIDVAKAKEAALAQADAGIDFWIECGEGPALGTIEAAKERGGFATGYVGDMTENGPNVVLVNIVWNVRPVFEDMIQRTLDGSFDAPFYQYGVREGAFDVTVNPALADQVPAEALEAMEAAKAQILSGELEVPYVPQ